MVQAAPVRGSATASASETKKPSLSGARVRALKRARKSALQSALGRVTGPVDGSARKAVLKSFEAWTGAYRILSETNDGESVKVELEVEIDLVRLTKRVQKQSGGKPAFVLGTVTPTGDCGEANAIVEQARTELSAQGAVALDGKGPALDLAIECAALGPVQHTYLVAAQVRVVATAGGSTMAEHSVPAFATTAPEAMVAGMQSALLDVGQQLATRRKGHIRLRVRSAMPSARVRRLETAMRNSVLGVSAVDVAGIERGIVELRVRGSLSAKVLARRLKELSVPGVSVSVVKVDPPDALTIALE